MTPYELVKQHYKLPFELYPFQVDIMNDLALNERAGYYMAVGTGKTITSISAALYKLHLKHVKRVVCVMPPVLLVNWERNIQRIPGVSVVRYQGSPKVRSEINLDVQFILVGYQIFKKDYAYLSSKLEDTVLLLLDEGQAVKNIGSDTYKKVRDFSITNQLAILTGTPLTTPNDGYAYVNLISPGTYRSFHQFSNIHTSKTDFFGNVVEWRNLDLLRENMELNSRFITQAEAIKDLPEITYNPIFYDLDPGHAKLYRKLADEQLLRLDDGKKIDVTNTSALIHALSQIPMNAEHFSGGALKSTGLDLLDELMAELGTDKLVVFTQYRMTNKRLLDYCARYNAVGVYGEITGPQKQANIDRFVQDPTCRMIIMQQSAGGVGVDGLQTVCNTVLFLEMGYTSTGFEQAVARVLRTGQTKPVTVHLAVAVGTIQKKTLDVVLQKDTVLGVVQKGAGGLRAAIYGE